MRVDLRGVPASSGGFEPIPDGEYRAKVRSAEEKANHFLLEFEVLDEPFAGRKVVDRLFATEKALPRFRAALTALGVPADGLVEIEPRTLIGREVYLTLEPDSFTDRNGVFRRTNKVSFEGYRAVEPAPQRPIMPAPPPHPGQRAALQPVPRPGGFQARAKDDIPF